MASTSGATTTATSTEYAFLGDLLLATIDQPIFNGTATGTPTTSYVHSDHLGSTIAVTNASGTVVQVLDYYPYGSLRINNKTGGTDEKRKFIGREYDDSSQLSYLMARYYDGSRGQFLSEDPMFWSQKQNLADPQTLNSYSYASDNPITKKDPDGLLTQAQNTQLNGIKAQLLGIQAQLNSYSSGGGGSLSSIQQSVNSAVAAISRIAMGGGATLGPSYQWAPQTSNKTVTPYTPNVANGVVPVYGTDSDKLFALGLLTMLPVPGGEYLFGGATAAKFFEGTVYSEKVIRQMEWGAQAVHGANDYHAFPELVRNFAGNGTVVNGVGDAFRTLNIPGGYNGVEGTFQFMKNSEGVINHRLFIPY